MRFIRLALVALILAVASSTVPVSAASYSTDQSDLYWADPPSSENGWGFQIVQRGSTIFITMFVYGPPAVPGSAGTPIWYVATMTPSPPGSFVWSGDLYVTTGPWFGAVPYNPALFMLRKVGTMTWAPNSVSTGVLSYTVDGVAVAKNAIRQTLVIENYSGHFGGAIHQTTTFCANPAFNGTLENVGVINIVQSGTAFTLTAAAATGVSCAYSGTVSQSGQMGSVLGSFSCSDGSRGSFNAFEMQITEISVTGRFTASYTVPAACQATGWFGGLTVTTI